MSLFSTSPSGLLFAVEQSLRGALAALVRADPQGGHSTDPRDYLLLFAVDKTLPSKVLAETTRLFRDLPIPHVGVLSAPVSGSLLPPNAISDAPQTASSSSSAPPQVPPFYHSVSLSLLPSTLAQPFLSDIPGVPPIKAGRWASGKPVFDENDSRVEHLDEQGNWRSIWGKENVSGRLPDALKSVDPSSHLLTLILGSDASPQGLLEGVDSHFPSSPLLGSIATNTVFETGGRETTMFYRADAQESTNSRIIDKGAVGLYLRSSEKIPSDSTRARPSVDVQVPWTNFAPLGPRREITRAKGNIISTLETSNACQHFLRDVAARDRAQSGGSGDGLPTKEEDMSMEAKARGMDKEEQRLLSKGVKKEEDFWAAIWASNEHSRGPDEKPLLFARILSGHPSRGTISLDTDLELDTGLNNTPVAAVTEGTSPKLYLEFYQLVDTAVTPLEIPGKDLSAWRLPRFLFINDQSHAAGAGEAEQARGYTPPDKKKPSQTHQQQQSAQDDKASAASAEKPAVHTLPNVFVLSSENGMISRDPAGVHNSKAAESGAGGKIIEEITGDAHHKQSSAASTLQSRTGTWRANGVKGWVDLRGRSATGTGTK